MMFLAITSFSKFFSVNSGLIAVWRGFISSLAYAEGYFFALIDETSGCFPFQKEIRMRILYNVAFIVWQYRG